MQIIDGHTIDDNTTEPAAEKAVKRLKPRRMSRTSPVATSMSIPEDPLLTPSKKGAAATSNATSPTNVAVHPHGEEGCKVCHRDVDHPNLLLCEACNDEYHTYCLKPPLQSVPEGDFFCGELCVCAHWSEKIRAVMKYTLLVCLLKRLKLTYSALTINFIGHFNSQM